MEKNNTPKLLNLTSKESCIYNDSKQTIAKLPSRGELRICICSYKNYPLHSIHYYDGVEETGIPISPAKNIKLDEKSPGYASLDNLTREDCIIVSKPVAQFLMLNNKSFVPQTFVVDSSDHSLIYNTETSIGVKRLEWCF